MQRAIRYKCSLQSIPDPRVVEHGRHTIKRQRQEVSVQALTEILNAVTTEAFSVHVLRALQAMATVAGVLNMKDAMHAVIAAVCSFTVDSPPAVAGGAKGLAGLREAGPPCQQKSPASAEDSSAPFAAAAALPRPYVPLHSLPSKCLHFPCYWS